MGARHGQFCSGSIISTLWIVVFLLHSGVEALVVNPRTISTTRIMTANNPMVMMHGRRRYSLPSSTIEGDNTNVDIDDDDDDDDDMSVDILQSKLTILQDVVKELHGRRLRENDTLNDEEQERRLDAAQQTKRLQAQLKASEMLLAQRGTELENLQHKLVELQKRYQEEVEDYQQKERWANIHWKKQVEQLQKERGTDRVQSQSQLEVQDREMQALQTQMKQESRQQQATIQELQKELASMMKLQDDKELVEQRRQSQDALQQAKSEEEIAEKEAQFEIILQNAREQQKVLVEGYEHRLEAMTAQMETLSTTTKEHNEQIEIATAAVRAAEQRETQLRVQTNKLQEQLKRTQLHVKLQQVVLDGVELDREQAQEDLRQLKTKLRRAQQHIGSLEAEKSMGLWSRMRSRLSRKPKVPL